MLTETVTQATEQAEGTTVLVSTIVKFGAGMVFIMAIIYLLAVFTPKIAKYVDKYLEKHRPERVDERLYEVKGIYDLPRNNYDKKENSVSESADSEQKEV